MRVCVSDSKRKNGRETPCNAMRYPKVEGMGGGGWVGHGYVVMVARRDVCRWSEVLPEEIGGLMMTCATRRVSDGHVSRHDRAQRQPWKLTASSHARERKRTRRAAHDVRRGRLQEDNAHTGSNTSQTQYGGEQRALGHD